MSRWLRPGMVLATACLAVASLPASGRSAGAPALQQRAEGLARGPIARAEPWRPHLDQATALTDRARDTGNADDYQRALEHLRRARAFGSDPGAAAQIDLVEAWVRLGRHEFSRAEALSRSAVERRRSDPRAWAVWGDALMELGRYEAARAAYQQLLELRPGPLAYLRAAHYWEITGAPAASIELWRAALAATPTAERGKRAWILVQLANLLAAQGELSAADRLHTEALGVLPDYHAASAGAARLALRRNDAARAETLARAAFAAAPHPEYRLLVADALRQQGLESEARAQEAAFEGEALDHVEEPDNENLFLVDFYLDRRPAPMRALELAQREAARRSDVETARRLARALEATGRVDAASDVRQRLRRIQSSSATPAPNATHQPTDQQPL